MQASSIDPDCGTDSSLTADALMVSRMRLVLSVSALLAVAVDLRDPQQRIGSAVWLTFSCYAIYSLGGAVKAR